MEIIPFFTKKCYFYKKDTIFTKKFLKSDQIRGVGGIKCEIWNGIRYQKGGWVYEIWNGIRYHLGVGGRSFPKLAVGSLYVVPYIDDLPPVQHKI